MVNSFHRHSDIDITRSVIVSATYSEDSNPNKVHILKLEYLAKIFGIKSPIKDVLNILEGLREVQHIGNGFWVPAPTRAIYLSNDWIICSPSSTSQLASSGVEILPNEGFARLMKTPLQSMLVQSIEDWMGGRMHFLLEWISDLMSIVRTSLQPTILDKNSLEYYVPWNTQKNKKFSPPWIACSNIECINQQDVFLTRVKDSKISTYYWCSLNNGSLLESLSLVPKTTNEIIKLQFALEILHEFKGRGIKVISENNFWDLICNYPLPIEMDRLLTAIGRKSIHERQTTYIISNKHVDFVRNQLCSLNIKFV